MERLLLVASALSGALILMILVSLRRAHIRVEYSVSWLAAGLLVLVLSRWQAALLSIGEALGLHDPAATLLTIGLGVLLFVVYRISMIVSELKDNNIALAQKVAMLEYRLESSPEGE